MAILNTSIVAISLIVSFAAFIVSIYKLYNVEHIHPYSIHTYGNRTIDYMSFDVKLLNSSVGEEFILFTDHDNSLLYKVNILKPMYPFKKSNTVHNANKKITIVIDHGMRNCYLIPMLEHYFYSDHDKPSLIKELYLPRINGYANVMLLAFTAIPYKFIDAGDYVSNVCTIAALYNTYYLEDSCSDKINYNSDNILTILSSYHNYDVGVNIFKNFTLFIHVKF